MKIGELIDELEVIGEGDEVVLGDVLNMLQGRSLGVLLSFIALFNLIPIIGSLPGIPALTGGLILVLSAQSLLAGRSSIWLPQRWMSKSISRSSLKQALEKSRPWLVWLDRVIRPRMRALADHRIVALCSIFLALMFFPLSFIPWGVVVPAMAVLLLALALIGHDGFMALVGYGFSAVSLWFVWTYTPLAFNVMAGWLS